MNWIFKILLFYIIYHVIFRVIVPLFNSPKQVNKGTERQEDFFRSPNQKKQTGVKKEKSNYGEYIEYEEIKTKRK